MTEYALHHVVSSSQRVQRLLVSRMFPGILQKPPEQSGMSCKSQKLMLYFGLIQQSCPGTFHLLPMAVRAFEKLVRLIDRQMDSVGAQKLVMPCLTSGELWKSSGRWNTTGAELFTLQDRHDIDHCLGPTHEEPVTSLLAAQFPLSYKKLPIRLYQISRKFRDEMHPRFGLLRSREFDMKDLYTFDSSEDTARETYTDVCDAYCRLFDQLHVKYYKVEGSTGNIGGSLSHEFHFPADIGEDTILVCKKCGKNWNKELSSADGYHPTCKESNCDTIELTGIEVGHSFLLGTKYSSVFRAQFLQENGKPELLQMGCYGLGVSRILAACIEVLSFDDQIRWPALIAPYQICVIPQKAGYKADITYQLCVQLQDALSSHSALSDEVVLDDRLQLSIGKRMFEAKKMGYPFIIVAGKKALEDPPLFELLDLHDESVQFLTKEQLCQKLSMVETV